MPIVARMNKHDELRKLWKAVRKYSGTRCCVRGNGSCWLYAVLGTLGCLDHGREAPFGYDDKEILPSAVDQTRSALLLKALKGVLQRYAGRLAEGKLVTPEVQKNAAKLHLKEVWPGGRRSTPHGASFTPPTTPGMGDYGGNGLEAWCISAALEMPVLILDKNRLSKGHPPHPPRG
jgi:hypothetical protein